MGREDERARRGRSRSRSRERSFRRDSRSRSRSRSREGRRRRDHSPHDRKRRRDYDDNAGSHRHRDDVEHWRRTSRDYDDSRDREYGERGREGEGRDRSDRRYRDEDPRRHGKDDSRRRSGRERDEDSERSERQAKKENRHPQEEDEIDEGADVMVNFGAGDDEDEAERVKEESRKRRQAILEKYKQTAQTAGPAANEAAKAVDASTAGTRFETHDRLQNVLSASNLPVLESVAGSISNGQFPAENAIAAGRPSGIGKPPPHPVSNGAAALRSPPPAQVESPKSGNSNDMFADDIFAESPGNGRLLARKDGAAKDASGLNDNWDDAEGYYTARAGEVLDSRYEVVATHGRGVFSSVVKAFDLQATGTDRREVAIKIIRSNETMFKAGQQELVILRKIAGGDPEDKRHCVRLLSSFQFRGHLCLVFESLQMNLREVLKKFGRNIGISLNAVRAYATQLFMALKHLRNCGILHCDIKPDNMLVNEAKNVLKLADFGSAMFCGDNEITPYLVSRFYRAPEIMLGLTYEHALDMWSVGCCLYELYTGKMLFPGRNNNDMLRLHIELKGPFPKKLLKKAAFVDQHFDSDYNFCALEEDPVTKKTLKRILTNVKPKDMSALLATPGSSSDDSHALAAFRDLLDKMLALDPDRRITASQALSHPFVTGGR